MKWKLILIKQHCETFVRIKKYEGKIRKRLKRKFVDGAFARAFKDKRGKEVFREKEMRRKTIKTYIKREKGKKSFLVNGKWWKIIFHFLSFSFASSRVQKKFGAFSFHLCSFSYALIRIKFASFAFQLVHIVTGGIVRRTWSSIEGFRTMDARRLNRRTQVCQTAQ